MIQNVPPTRPDSVQNILDHGLPVSSGQRATPAIVADSPAACVEITEMGIINCLNYRAIFIVYT